MSGVPQSARVIALVAEDHELYRLGLANILQRDCGFERIIQAASLDDDVQHLGEHPEISFATFDLGMPGMQDTSSLRGIRQVFPKLVIVVVSASERRKDMLGAIAAGVHGFVPKSSDTASLARALTDVLDGRVFLPWHVTALPPECEVPELPAIPSAHMKSRLTGRQQDVLQLLRERRTNKQIARELGLTENTVKVHTVAIYRILGVNSRDDAISTKLN